MLYLKKLGMLILVFLALALSIKAQSYSKVQGWAEQGGVAVTIQGSTSTTKWQQSYPSCTITVYDAGTTNLATIYLAPGGPGKSNPFTADSNAYWFFYGITGTSYDIRFSGTGITTPFTLGATVAGGTAGITALTGDVTASGTGSVAATLANTAVTPGSYTSANITVDSKGRITAAANGSGGGGTPGGSSGNIQVNNAGSFAGLTGSSFSGSDLTLAGKLTHSSTGIVEDYLISNLTNIISIGTDAPTRIGLTQGTSLSPTTSRFPTISAITYTQPVAGGGNTTVPYFFGTVRANGGAQPAIYNLMGYCATSDTNASIQDCVGTVGFAVANAGSTSRAIGVYGEATINNNNVGQGAYHELRTVNSSGVDSPIPTTSLPAGYTETLQLTSGGNINTIALGFGGTGTYRTLIHPSGNVIASGGYGIDFNYSTRGTPLRLANNDLGIVARNAAASADRSLLKFNSSNQVLIANDGDVTIFGSSIRPGAGSFIANTAQFYTTASQGLVITAGTGSTYDLLIGSRDGSTLATVISNTKDLQLGAGTGQVYLGGGPLATNATTGFPTISSSAGAPTGAPTLTAGYVAIEFDSTNNYLYTYSSGWKAYQPAFKGGDVTSAAAIVPTGRTFHVTGTTNITSITSTGIVAGTVITIIFDGVLTFTDGSNLKLAGNFVTTADDTITLQYDGTNWYEIARSVN